MKLSKAIEHFKNDVDEFGKHYQNGMENTDYYPEELDLEEWYEQFTAYLALEED